jgi:hypothetical protein
LLRPPELRVVELTADLPREVAREAICVSQSARLKLPWRDDVVQLVDWVRDGTPSPVTAGHARHVIDIIENVYRSAATGSTEHLTTSFDREALPVSGVTKRTAEMPSLGARR